MAAGDGHSSTPASWTTVTIALVGFVVGGVGVIIAEPWVVAVGVGVIVLGAIVGKAMQMMGMGSTNRE